MGNLEPWQRVLRQLAGDARASSSMDATWEGTRSHAHDFIQAAASWDLASVGLAADQLDLLHDAFWSPGVEDSIDRLGSLPSGALHYFNQHQLLGITNAISGTLFEQTVATMANDGLIALPDGADHVILAGRTQEGWDLTLMKGDQAVGVAQVKFSDGGATIMHHLHNHTDVPIVIANHEAAMAAHAHGIDVIDTHIAYSSIHDPVANDVAGHFGVDHTVHEWVPAFAILVIAGRAMAMLQDGTPYETVKKWFAAEAGTAGMANAAATTAAILSGTEMIRLPVALTARSILGRGRSRASLSRFATECRKALEPLHSPEPMRALT